MEMIIEGNSNNGNGALEIDQICLTNFDLSNYISNYTGSTKYIRLKFIIEQYPLLKVKGYNIIIKDLQLGGMQISIFTSIFNFLDENTRKEILIGAGLDDMIWRHNEAILQKKLEALESELTTAKSSMIKESIRKGHNDIGNLFYQMGSLNDALKSYLRSKDFCSLPRHNCELCLNVISVSIDLNQFFNVSNYINKVTDYGDDQVVIAKINAASGLLCIRDQQYKQAAFKFLSIDPVLGNQFNSSLTSEDIALYGTVCALVSFNRKELRTNLIENKPFMNGYLSLYPDIKSLAKSFYDGHYSCVLQLLVALKTRLLIDIHLFNQAEKLIKLISDRLYLQYLTPYCIIDMTKMASVFDVSENKLEEVLVMLISSGQYNARIDSQTNTLQRITKSSVTDAIHKVISLSKTHVSAVKRDMLRLSLLQHGLIVDEEDEYNNGAYTNNLTDSVYQSNNYTANYQNNNQSTMPTSEQQDLRLGQEHYLNQPNNSNIDNITSSSNHIELI